MLLRRHRKKKEIEKKVEKPQKTEVKEDGKSKKVKK